MRQELNRIDNLVELTVVGDFNFVVEALDRVLHHADDTGKFPDASFIYICPNV